MNIDELIYQHTGFKIGDVVVAKEDMLLKAITYGGLFSDRIESLSVRQANKGEVLTIKTFKGAEKDCFEFMTQDGEIFSGSYKLLDKNPIKEGQCRLIKFEGAWELSVVVRDNIESPYFFARIGKDGCYEPSLLGVDEIGPML